jgi:hypothetical protein
MADDDAFWTEQFTEVMRMAATVTNAADAVMDAMRGDLGPDVKTVEQAAPIIRQRIDAYAAAKRELVEYGRAMMAALEQVSR